MPVDFLDIAPLEAEVHVATIPGRDGTPKEVRIFPIDNTALARLARRTAELRALFRSDLTGEQRLMIYYEFAPQVIAAALGKLGDKAYEAAVERMKPGDRRALLNAVFAVSFGTKDEEDEGDDNPPKGGEAARDAANDNAPSPPQSNSSEQTATE
jgi:hypothetical protein